MGLDTVDEGGDAGETRHRGSAHEERRERDGCRTGGAPTRWRWKSAAAASATSTARKSSYRGRGGAGSSASSRAGRAPSRLAYYRVVPEQGALPAMGPEQALADALARLRAEGRYRVFADLERHCGSFPCATWRGPEGPVEVTVWCSNDYLGMGQHPSCSRP